MHDTGIPVRHILGPAPGRSDRGLVLLHGRGSSAGDMIGLADAMTDGTVTVLAPDAPHGSWYPQRFLVPVEMNQPWLDRALSAVESAITSLNDAGVPVSRIVVAGFSQGACLAVEAAARTPRAFGAVIAFAGALVGPDPLSGGYGGDFGGTRILLASGDADQHVPVDYVRRTESVLKSMSAEVTLRIRPGMGHGIHPDDLALAVQWMDGV